jgi:translation initiation factor 2A
MPAKATIFNVKCDPVFELGESPRNSIYYNHHGNILLLGGFGNLPGYVELWDVSARKLINKMTAPLTTGLSWSPDSQHFMTGTTAPRLRTCNGFVLFQI